MRSGTAVAVRAVVRASLEKRQYNSYLVTARRDRVWVNIDAVLVHFVHSTFATAVQIRLCFGRRPTESYGRRPTSNFVELRYAASKPESTLHSRSNSDLEPAILT